MKGLYRGFCRNDNGTETIVLNGEKIKGEWKYGSLVNRCHGEGEGIFSNCELKIKWETVDRYFIIPEFREGCYEVLPETVCEAVRGLTDRNGKQVFEGDIIERETTFHQLDRANSKPSHFSFCKKSSTHSYTIKYHDYGMAYNEFPIIDDYWRGLNDNEYGIWRMQSKEDNFAVIGTIFDEQFAEGENSI